MSDKIFALSPVGIFWPIIKENWLILLISVLLLLVLRIVEFYLPRKEFKFFLRKHRIEFFTFVFTVAGYSISYMFLEKPGTAFFLGVIVTFIATVVLIYSKISEKDFYFISLKKSVDKEDWMGNGKFEYERVYDAFSITESDSGFIYSKCLTWSDYSVDFDFKILNTSLGVVLRATNLSNLVMMQIFNNKIKAHIRVNGFWKYWESEETNLFFENNLSLDKWYHGRFCCDKGFIKIQIDDIDGENLFDRAWKIPSGQILFDSVPNENVGLLSKSTISAIPFSINLDYGTIGFRNHGKEKALIADVLIEKLQGSNSIN